MSNNFPDWHREHPTKTFSEFVKEKGSVETAVPPFLPPGSITNKKRIIFALFIGIAIGVLGVYFMKADLTNFLLPVKTPEEVLNSKWTRYVYSKSGWSIESPERLEEKPLKLTEQEVALVTEAYTISFQPSKNFKVEGVAVLYRENVFPNLPLILRNNVQNLIHQGVTNLEFKESPVAFQNLRGVLLEGTFHKQGEFMRFQLVVYSNKYRHWQLFMAVADEDNVGKSVAEKIINSLEIEEDLKSI